MDKSNPCIIRRLSDIHMQKKSGVRQIMVECPTLVNFKKQKSEGDPFVLLILGRWCNRCDKRKWPS